MKHNETSIKEDREYGSTIFKGSDKNGTYVVATVPKRANRIGKAMGTVNPSKPLNGEEVVGWVHSHGSSKNGRRDFNHFSIGDFTDKNRNQIVSYVVTPGGFLNRSKTIGFIEYSQEYGAYLYEQTTINSQMPKDINDNFSKFYKYGTPYAIQGQLFEH